MERVKARGYFSVIRGFWQIWTVDPVGNWRKEDERKKEKREKRKGTMKGYLSFEEKCFICFVVEEIARVQNKPPFLPVPSGKARKQNQVLINKITKKKEQKQTDFHPFSINNQTKSVIDVLSIHFGL